MAHELICCNVTMCIAYQITMKASLGMTIERDNHSSHFRGVTLESLDTPLTQGELTDFRLHRSFPGSC